MCLVSVSFLENSTLATFLSTMLCHANNAHAISDLKVLGGCTVLNERHARKRIIA